MEAESQEQVPRERQEEVRRSQFSVEQDQFRNEESQISPKITLPLILRLLFGLNGVTLSLESLVIMYILNTRVAMPLPYLATYGAISFLPWSLKPMYAYFSQGRSRLWIFTTMLFANGLCLIFTSMIPDGAVFLAFLMGFLRSLSDAWAEFCLGLTLVDHARVLTHRFSHNYGEVSGTLQAEAATARNIGSFVANIITCLILLHRQIVSPEVTQLSGAVADSFLICTGLLQLVGVFGACMSSHVFETASLRDFQLVDQLEHVHNSIPEPDEASALRDDDDSHPSYSSQEDPQDEDSLESIDQEENRVGRYRANGILIILLQAMLIVFTLKQLIVDGSSHLVWKLLLITLILATVILTLMIYSYQWWYVTHRVGLYLVLKHAIPSDAMVLGSFSYFLFEKHPLQLQFLSLVGAGATTFSSWSYGKLLAPYNTGNKFLIVIATTTVLGALASLGNIAVYNNSTSGQVFLVAVLMKVLTSFFGEWSFLPDVVLATNSVVQKEDAGFSTDFNTRSQDADTGGDSKSSTIAVEYGTLISCIDFGGQLGSLFAGPLVAFLGITRDNNFQGLDRLVLLGSVFAILSLSLLALLKKSGEM